MGDITLDHGWRDLSWVEVRARSRSLAYYRLFRSHSRDHAAERQRGGFGGSVWRRWEPDGIWPARSCDISFEGHHVVRNRVHGDVAHAFGEAHA